MSSYSLGITSLVAQVCVLARFSGLHTAKYSTSLYDNYITVKRISLKFVGMEEKKII
jgi:hypothetical protein